MTVILQHEANTTAGSTELWLNLSKKPYQICKLYKGDSLPLLTSVQEIIICGGSMNVDQESKIPWLTHEKKWIQQALRQKKKIVGLCLGGQLLAEALGAQVGPLNFSEVGWSPMTLSQNQRIGTLAGTLSVFQWHSYCFKEVPKALTFAGNKAWPYQGFTFENHVVGFQYHPESTRDWILECAHDKKIPQGEFCQTSEQMLENIAQQHLLQKHYFDILNHFFNV